MGVKKMTTPSTHVPATELEAVALDQVRAYLTLAGWQLRDEDGRTSLWLQTARQRELRVVLPARRNMSDYGETLATALQTVAYAERRAPSEVLGDLISGAADSVSVRLTPETPSGQAPLSLAVTAVNALHDYVVGSAAALDVDSLVLPPRRPVRAESYAGETNLSTSKGSFILTLTLPLVTAFTPDSDDGQLALVDVPPQPYGRSVTRRMRESARSAIQLAREVSSGSVPIRAFGETGGVSPNATELAALARLGGTGHSPYELRFAETPLASSRLETLRLSVTATEQGVMAEAADFLRTKQPREGVTVEGLVIRLFRTGIFGSGEAVIQGPDDDTGVPRKFRVSLSEHDYNEAVRAHQEGLKVIASGDLEISGTRRSLVRISNFAIVPGLEDS